jgi:rhamnulokinase
MTGDDAAYISCGTWGLVGVELDKPVVTEASRAANHTNEAGVEGRIRYLTNVMGTWLLSESMRSWGLPSGDLTRLLEQAAAVDADVPVFDVQDPRFLAPGDMPARIASYCAEHHIATPDGQAPLVRSIVESLAAGFARAVEMVASIVQGRALAAVTGQLEDLRALIARTHDLVTYEPIATRMMS